MHARCACACMVSVCVYMFGVHARCACARMVSVCVYVLGVCRCVHARCEAVYAWCACSCSGGGVLCVSACARG